MKRILWALALTLAIPVIAFGGEEVAEATIASNKDAIALLQTNLNFVHYIVMV